MDDYYDPNWDDRYGPWFSSVLDGERQAWIARASSNKPLSEGALTQLVQAGLIDSIEPSHPDKLAWPDGLREFLMRRSA
jgi:hypothetical protein